MMQQHKMNVYRSINQLWLKNNNTDCNKVVEKKLQPTPPKYF